MVRKFLWTLAISLPLWPQATSVSVSADVNGRTEAVVWHGVPVVVSASVFLTEGSAATVALRDGTWTAALRPAIYASDGQAVNLPLRLIEAPAATVQLRPAGRARAFWVLSGEQTAALPPGEYGLVVSFDTREVSADGGWQGTADSGSVTFTAGPEPSTLTEDDAVTKARFTAAYHALIAEWPAAVTTLEDALRQWPEQLTLLGDLAEALEGAGRLEDALARANEALALFAIRNPDSDHPAFDLLRTRNRIRARIVAAEVQQ
jgi:hypothetical protein